MLRKLTWAILGMATCGNAIAEIQKDSLTVCVPGNMTFPCSEKKWNLGIEALYLKATTTNRIYSDPSVPDTPDIHYEWNWGFALDGSYHVNTGNDINMNWLHYGVTIHGPSSSIGTTSFGVTNYSLQQQHRFDRVNLVMGQHTDVGRLTQMRFFGGLQYANIRGTITRNFQLPTAAVDAGITAISENNNADFNGVGPVIGVNYSYPLRRGINMTASTASSILYGTSRNNRALAYGPTGYVPASVYLSKRSIVPSLEAKLGLNYAQVLAEGVLNFSGGYQVLNYFSPLALIQVSGHVVNANAGLYGPYLGLNWLGNI